MSKLVVLHSTFNLEHWDWRNPWTKGIGGSETQHIEMAQRLKRRNYDVISIAPIGSKYLIGPMNVAWPDATSANTFLSESVPGIYIWHRDPAQFDRIKTTKQKFYFIAQDVDYPTWTEERLAKVDRYICLCADHASYTLSRYPSLKGRVYISSNGIRSNYLRNHVIPRNKFVREPNRLFFPSSPDRGIKFLLENWFRVKEINPQAEVYVAYGFDNMDSIKKLYGEDWRVQYKATLEYLSHQDGVHFIGRQNQHEIYDQWLKTAIWAHPTDFPETSCITCMEAQALGAYPVTNNLWALRNNVQWGWVVDGVPQNSELTKVQWLHALEQAFGASDRDRKEMSEWALENFDWERIVDQWVRWIEEDYDSI